MTAGGVPLDALARTAALLGRDVASTVGGAHVGEVAAEVAALRADPYDDAETILVERVQQTFHDLHVDTTWPACPRHPNHPLWYRDGAWWCTQDGAPVVPLGHLSSRQVAG